VGDVLLDEMAAILDGGRTIAAADAFVRLAIFAHRDGRAL
jgi:hypothetical protein